MMTQANEQMLEERLVELKQQLPELVSEDIVISEPSVEQPFAIPPRQRMDPIDITIEQVLCAEKALANKKKKQVKRVGLFTRRNNEGVKMKRVVKQVANKMFCYTQNEKETYVLNEGRPMAAYVTAYDNLAIFGVSINDRKKMNEKVEQMAKNSGLKGVVYKWDEEVAEEYTLFVKHDNKTQYFNAKQEKMKELPKKKRMWAKVCVRVTGIMKVDGQLKPMVRLWQVKLEAEEEDEESQEPCMLN